MLTLAFDGEIYPNLLVFNFVDVNNFERRWSFVIYEDDKSDWSKLKKFLTNQEMILVGYNNLRYDEILLKAILMGRCRNVYDVYQLSNAIIDKQDVPDYWDIYRHPVRWKSIDVMVLHRLRELRVGLKFVGVIIKHPLIQDLPIKPGTIIQPDQVGIIVQYCFNDVIITAKIYLRSTDELKVRQTLTERFGVDVTTDSRSGAAQKIMMQLYSEETGDPVWELRKKQTVRHQVAVKDCIGPNLDFKTPELKGLQRVLEILTLYQNTKTKTTDFYYNDLEAKPYNFPTATGQHKIQIQQNFKYKVTLPFGGKVFEVGVGGLHSKDEPGVYRSNAEYQLFLADVSSYYPSLQVVNKITPEHWGNYYINILNDLMQERLTTKELSKNDPDLELAANALKIVINSIFGRLGDLFSPLLDVRAMTTVTVSGQLYLLDLIEKINLNLNKTKLISANTDGIWCLVHRSEVAKFKEIGDTWAKRLGLALEYDPYKVLYQKDVNNYLSIDSHDKVKTKGAFYPGELKDGIWHKPIDKGYDAPIIAIAIYNYLVAGISPEETIKNHTDIYDFMITEKVGGQFQTVEFGADSADVLQKTNRYIVVTPNNGTSLVKRRVETGTLSNFEKGEVTQVINDVAEPDATKYPLRYNYYLDRVGTILDLFFPPQQVLLEF